MGAPLGLRDLDGAYLASLPGGPHINLDPTVGAFTLRDNATPIGDLLVLEDSAGDNIFDVDPAQMNYGEVGQRLFAWDHVTGGKGGAKYLPDAFTIVAATGQAALQWDSTVSSNVPGGAPFGNDSAPALVASIGECIFQDAPFLFATSLLFNQATTITTQGFNIGPIYTMVHQPLIRVGSVGGSRSCSQMNAVRAQAKIGPNVAGSLTQTSIEYFYSLLIVDATVGTVSCTTYTTLAQKAPSLVAGGTIGTLNVVDIANIPAAGITNIRGINSAMNNGFFLRHVGTATSQLGGPLQLGAGATMDWQISRAAANRADIATGDSLRLVNGSLQFVGTSGQLSSSVDGEIRLDVDKLGINQAPAGANWFFGFAANALTITVGGDFANCLNSTGGNHTINAALSTFTQWTINAPAGTLGTGSVVTAANVIIQTSVALGTNRYGLLVSSNPSGGTLNYCARFSGAAGVRIDGIFEHNGLTFGMYGVSPVTQDADIVALTDSTGGTADNTVAAVAGSGADATINNNFADVIAKINGLRDHVRRLGSMA